MAVIGLMGQGQKAPGRCERETLAGSRPQTLIHQLINLYRDQADIIGKVFGNCKLPDIGDNLIAELAGAQAGSLTH